MMNVHEVFNDSYARCNRNPNFLNLFYQVFIEKDPSYQQLFANSDMAKQYRMLKASIAMIMLAATSSGARSYLQQLGKRHGPHGVGVSPLDFEIWFNSLLEAVKICDPYYDAEIEQAWRECFRRGMAIMKEECETKG